jgi:DNA polymerase
MYAVRLAEDAGAEGFKAAARRLLAHGIAPADVMFVSHDAGILFDVLPPGDGAPPTMTVPRAFAELMEYAVLHSAADRFALLYDVLWRIAQGARDLCARASDPKIAQLATYARNVRRDIHKMHAFVRFHEKQGPDGPVFVAWFEPQHHVLRRATPFFADRFASMRWLIATPLGTASWDLNALVFGPPVPKPEGLEDPVLGGLWATYYRTIFNPARLKVKAMVKEMPKHYWRNMPETALIPGLLEQAPARVAAMAKDADAAPRFAPTVAARRAEAKREADAAEDGAIAKQPLGTLRKEAASCTRCDLYRHATQTVFGEGPAHADIVLVGEQPGDQEDLAGKPFVGPAGQLLDRALEEAGIERDKVYITNAVKHFKFEPRGKRRIHAKPNAGEIKACKWWLDHEFATLSPKIVVALGATAAQALTGRAVAVTKMRGHETELQGQRGIITVHPSYLLRIPDEASKTAEYKKFVADLKLARKLAEAA